MRFATVAALFLFSFPHPSSNGQATFPVPPSGDQGARLPPVVTMRPGIAPPNPEANRKQLLADLQELIGETRKLQQDLQVSLGHTVSAESFKRAQKMEMLSKRIRKTLKAN
jgi:hypothetical protein